MNPEIARALEAIVLVADSPVETADTDTDHLPQHGILTDCSV